MCPIFSVLVDLMLGWQTAYSKANFQDSVFFILKPESQTDHVHTATKLFQKDRSDRS